MSKKTNILTEGKQKIAAKQVDLIAAMFKGEKVDPGKGM